MAHTASTTGIGPAWFHRALLATAVVVALAAGSAVAAAASLPTTRAMLFASDLVGSTGAPTVLAWSNFTGASGTNLSGKALNAGGAWTVHLGTFVIDTLNRGRATPATAYANMSVNAGVVAASVEVVLTFTTTARRAGVTFNDDGSNGMFAEFSDLNGGQALLFKADTTGITQIGSALGLGAPASVTLRVDATTTTTKVFVNGVQKIAYTLTALESTTFRSAANTRFGLIADNDAGTRFDDFHVDGP